MITNFDSLPGLDRSHILGNLTGGVVYAIRVVAKSHLGASVPGQPLHEVTAEKFSLFSTCLGSQSVSLKWFARRFRSCVLDKIT